jgi:hypothetical protein
MKKIGSFILFMALAGCIQKFQPVLSSPPTGYLVVGGIINAGGGAASVTLSRTTRLSDSSFAYEQGALVQVEGNDSSIYTLGEEGNGIYGTTNLTLNSALLYRIRIKTAQGEEFLSDFVPISITPPIDSLSWQADSTGIQLYASTHDPLNHTRYYQWSFLETWEYHSPYLQQLRYDTISDPSSDKPEPGITPLATGEDTAVFTCWRSAPSTQILIATSLNLQQDVISRFPLTFIDSSSQKISVEYSSLVSQYALTAAAFNFLQVMQKNTEETGSVFGSEPTQLQGNIHSLTHPGETVVGYVEFSTVQTKRLFIDKGQLPGNWVPLYPDCAPDLPYAHIIPKTGMGDPYIEIKAAMGSGLIPISIVRIGAQDSVQFIAVPAPCVNCTLTGTNIKPSFWP